MKQILLVDDSHFFIQVVTEFLKRSGHNILAAKSGREALKVLESNSPDIILMDYYMSDMNGDECCRTIKSNPALKGIPVIMLTSAGKDEDIERCRLAGCDDYVTKPVDKMALLTKIKRYMPIPVREYKRAPISLDVAYVVDDKVLPGIIFSISEGGLFIKGAQVLDKGTSIKVNFHIPNIRGEIDAEVVVAWNTEERSHLPADLSPGFGVSFVNINDEGVDSIKKYVSLGDYLL